MNKFFMRAVVIGGLLLTPLQSKSPTSAENSLSVAKYTSAELELNWILPQLSLVNNPSGTDVWFNDGTYSGQAGKPAVPFKKFVIGSPEDNKIRWDIIIHETETLNDILPATIEIPSRDKNGVSQFIHRPDSIDFNFLPASPVELSEPQFFRDMPIRIVNFYPISYDHSTRTLKIIRRATIRFYFEVGSGFINRSGLPDKLSALYSQLVLNHEQARNFVRERQRKLSKTGFQYEAPYYRIEVNKNGLHKITRSAMTQAGIDLATLDPRTIKLWNSGGQPLNISTAGPENDPPGPQENAIYVSGEEDGSFDEGDYILFYGSGPGGWFLENNLNDFVYINHPYSRKNYYVLTFGGAPGKRMPVVQTPQSGATATDDFFLDRQHFEDDQYNLLASGSDWYGHRFFGRDASHSFTYNIDAQSGSVFPARFRIRFKSGNGVKWSDDTIYRYNFSVFLNPSTSPAAVLNNIALNRREGRIFERSFISSDYLVTGDNTLSITYSANLQECSAYLDWVEFYYPKPFTAKNNYLQFYTNTKGQVVSYNIGGFDQDNILVFDVTNPVLVQRMNAGSSRTGSQYAFNLDLTDNTPRRIIVASSNSAAITSVSSLSPYIPSKNLLDPSIAAELIIITHPSFESYADEVIKLRATDFEPVNGTVVNTSDIYFYFNSGVQDPVAIRNFIRYAYMNWTNPAPVYVLLFGDGHYDYRNIALPDTNRVPPYEISDDYELNSRETDNFYVDVNFNSSTLSSISPDLAVGRLPMESHLDAERMIEKLTNYKTDASQDGWQTVMTFVGDDQISGTRDTTEWIHQRQTESLATLPEINKFLKKKIYLSRYSSVPGGFGRVKPEANQAIIDQLNEGTLMINYVGHGSPTEWAHESVLNLTRDLNRIQNQGKLTFWIAATCDFGKYDDPRDPSFTEALIWQENAGAIGVVSSSRLVFSGDNFAFNTRFMRNLFPSGGASRRLGDAMLLASYSGTNDQKYHLFADPSMYLADPRLSVYVNSVQPDTLKALSKVTIQGNISGENGGQTLTNFEGGAFLIVNDAGYDSVNTGGPDYYTLGGPRIFKGEVSVENGLLTGSFIVPKSIRYQDKKNGRITVYARDNDGANQAMGYLDTLLFNGTEKNLTDDTGPSIDIYFEGQEGFNNNDIIPKNPVLIADISDESGINLTDEVGHSIEIRVDEGRSQNITSFFSYNRDSYEEGKLTYHIEDLEPGRHSLILQAWDNLNNPTREVIEFRISDQSGLSIADVVNYPNPFHDQTSFTFQLQGAAAMPEMQIKIYTVSGRLIANLDNFSPPQPGFNYYNWNGRDDDGDLLANGVYIYKIIVNDGINKEEIIDKLVILR